MKTATHMRIQLPVAGAQGMPAGPPGVAAEGAHKETFLKAWALQSAILSRPDLSSIIGPAPCHGAAERAEIPFWPGGAA